jgi:ribosomal protein uS5
MEEIYLFSLPVKEYQIVDMFLPKLKDEVMKIMPVQKQTRAGQRTRFKAFVAVGDFDGHVGLGVKCAKEVATAIRGAIILAKLSVIPVRRGYWGAALGEPHTVPSKVSGKVGSVMCRLIPAPRGTGIVAAPASKRLLQLAGVEDCYTQSKGSTATMGNFLKATFAAVRALHPIVFHLSTTTTRSQKPMHSLLRIYGGRFLYRSYLMMSTARIYSWPRRMRSSLRLYLFQKQYCASRMFSYCQAYDLSLPLSLSRQSDKYMFQK